MAKITAAEVQQLRRATGAPILDCRRALEACDGDQEKAKQWLKEKGLVGAEKRSDRERLEGAVALYQTAGDSPKGAIVTLESETDFVAKAADFVSLVERLAAALAEGGEEALVPLEKDVEELKVLMQENIALGRHVRFVAEPGGVLGGYLHFQNGRGVNAVLVELGGGSPDLAHDVAVHIAFAKPEYLRREDVPAELVEAERRTSEAIARNEGKPEAAITKIVEGRLQGWYKDRVLLDQPYVRDEKRTVAQLLEGAELRRFAQIVVGS